MSLDTAFQIRVKPVRFLEIYTREDGQTLVLPPQPAAPAQALPSTPAESGLGRLERTLPALADVLLPESDHARLTAIFSQVKNADKLYNKWKLPELKQRRVVNFYGPPGTGKTMAAKALANYCGLPAYCLSVEQLMSKYMGSTPKNICRVFEEAAASSAVLILDEADSLLYSRVDATEAADIAYNQITSALLTMLDSSTMPIVFTTNRASAYDQAFARRIAHSVKFNVPDAPVRRVLLNSLVGALGLDVNVLAIASSDLTCADIRQGVANACAAVSTSDDPDSWVLTGEAVAREFSRLLATKVAGTES